jgi:hypothetical protein
MKSGAQSGAQRTKRSHDISTGPKPVKSAYLLRQLLSWDCAVNRSLFLRAIYLVNFDQSSLVKYWCEAKSMLDVTL